MARERFMNVVEIMSKKVVSVEMDDKLSAVKELFDRLKFHHLLVVESGKLVGVVSDRDLLKALSPKLGTISESEKDAATLNKRVHQVMTRNPFSLHPEASMQDAVDMFNAHRISCIPIVNIDNQPVGMLSWRDILKALATRLQGV
jgi:acetoin utilization protein AcuB